MPEQLFGQEQSSEELSIADKMNMYRFFIENSGKWTKPVGIGGMIFAIGGIVLMSLCFLIGYINGGVFGTPVDNIIAASCILATVVGIIAVFVACYRPSIKNVFVVTPSGDLWCAMSDKVIPSIEISRKQLLNERENIYGPSRDFTNVELKKLLSVIGYLDERELGNDVDRGYELDNIEDIEDIEDLDPEGAVKIVYTDKVSTERREITLDKYKWHDFLTWLNQKRDEY